MIRRTAVAALALVAAFGMASCSTFDNQQVAAVADHELSQDDLTAILTSPLTPQVFNGIAPIDGSMAGADVRGIVSVWITLAALEEGGLITDAQLEPVRTALADGLQADYTDAPAAVQDFFAVYSYTGSALDTGELDRDAAIAMIKAADVSVDSYYGVWDAEALSIDAMGTPSSEG